MLFCTASTPSCCKMNLQIADAHQSSTSTLALPRRSTSLRSKSRTAFFSVVAEHIQPDEARRVRRLFNLVCQIVEPFNLGNHVIHCHQLAPPRLIPVRRALPARFPVTPRTVPRRWRRKSRRAPGLSEMQKDRSPAVIRRVRSVVCLYLWRAYHSRSFFWCQGMILKFSHSGRSSALANGESSVIFRKLSAVTPM